MARKKTTNKTTSKTSKATATGKNTRRNTSASTGNMLKTTSVNGVKGDASSAGSGSIYEAGQYVKDFNVAFNSVSGNIDNVIKKYENIASKTKGALDDVVNAVSGLKEAWSTAVNEFSNADSVGEKIKAAWSGAKNVFNEGKNFFDTMQKSGDTFAKSMKEVGSLGKKMKIPGLDKVGKFAGPFKKLSGASGKLGIALKGLGGAMGAIDTIVQTWQTGWNLGKKLGEMLGLAKMFHNSLYGEQVEAAKNKMAEIDKKIKALRNQNVQKISKWLVENEGAEAAEKYLEAVRKEETSSAKYQSRNLAGASDKELNNINLETTKWGNKKQYYENLHKISKAMDNPAELKRLKEQNKGIAKLVDEQVLKKKYEEYSLERTSAFEEGRKQRQQYYINSVGLTPQQALQKKSEYYSQQMQKSKEFEERARINFEDAKNKDIGPAMRNFGREGDQERARQMKIAAQQANVNGWIKDYKDLDEISKREKSDQRITGYLDKIARNVVKIDQHTYGTKSNTEDMLRVMTNKESVTL